MNQIVKAAIKSAAKNENADIARQIEETAAVFDITGDELRHLKRAYMFANMGGGLVPDVFQGDYRSLFVMSMKAERMGLPLAELLQGGFVVYGKWAWSAEFMISRVLELGIFAALDYEIGGKMDDDSAFAIAVGTRPDGTKAKGTKVTMKMAKDEGWVAKKGSKWQTMPGLMLKKRAATFLIRECAAHAFGGNLQTEDEIQDVTPSKASVNSKAIDTLKATPIFDVTPEESPIETGKAQDVEEQIDIDEKERMSVFQAVEKMILKRKDEGAVDAELENTIGYALHEIESQSMKTLLEIAKRLK